MPKFLSFVVSFLYITIYWVNHHQLFDMVKRCDRGLFWLNSLFLMCLTFIPFPTALIGSYPRETLAVSFYGVAMFATAVSFVAMKSYIFYVGRLVEAHRAKPPLFLLVSGPLLYLAAVLLALLHTGLAIAVYLLVPVIYFAAGKLDEAVPE